MFRASSVPIDGFGGLSLVPSPMFNYTTLEIGSPQHHIVLEKFNADREVAYFRAARSEAVNTGDASTNGGGGFTTNTAKELGDALTLSMKELVENSKYTGSERERTSTLKETVNQFRILLAHRNPTTSEIEPATLSQEFNKIMLSCNRTVAVNDLRTGLADFLDTKRADQPMNV
eukprot:scaffold4181_cov79-Cylindrotheca_fusiformis.AAC.1